MRALMGTWLFALALLSALASPLSAQTERRPLRVGGCEGFAPYMFMSMNGEAQGIFVDIWRVWASVVGREVEFALLPGMALPRALGNGSVDIVLGPRRDETLDRSMDFSEPFLQTPGGLFFNNGLNDVEGIEDVLSMTVGVVDGDYARTFLADSGFDVHPWVYPSYEALVTAAIEGEIRVFIADATAGHVYLAEHPGALGQFKHTLNELYTWPVQAAVRKGDAALLQEIDAGLRQLDEDMLEAIVARWTPVEHAFRFPWGRALPYMLLALVCVLGVAGWNWLLRKRVRDASARLETQYERVARSERELRSVFQAMASLVLELDASGVILRVIPTRRVMSHFSKEELEGAPVTRFLSPRTGADFLLLLEQVLRNDQALEMEIEIPLPHGPLWLRAAVSSLGEDRALAVANDVTDRKLAEEALASSERYFSALIRNAFDLTTVIDAQGRILFEAPAAKALLGCDPERLLGRPLVDELHQDDRPAFLRLFHTCLEQDDKCRGSAELRRRKHDGGHVVLEVQFTNLIQDPDVAGVIINAHDVTQRKQFENELKHQVFHDPLTGLPNRSLLLDRLHHAMARTQRRDDHLFALLYINLDRFKLVNESLGHATGDALLKAVAQRVNRCLRRVDTVARFNGDEFVILLDEIDHQREALQVAERLRHELGAPHFVDGLEVFCQGSIGLAFSDPSYDDPGQIVRDAHTAMHWSKSRRSGCCEIFQASMQREAMRVLKLESELRRGIERREFELHYQPIVRLDTGQVVGVESLLRWRHPERGLLPPKDFIPLAEETGLIVPMGLQVLEEACRRLDGFQRIYCSNGSRMTLAVNLSARQFQHKNLAKELAGIIDAMGVDPGLLHFEITESTVMENPLEAKAILKEIRSLGVKLAIDDFGTGYSSLSYLYQFPFDTLKIDRSFVSGLWQRGGKNTNIVQAILALAESLELAVIAEGVETSFQQERLLQLGCTLGQGYLYAHPMDATNLEQFLAAQREAHASMASETASLQQRSASWS